MNNIDTEVDFFFDPKPLTKEEDQIIRDYIKADKEKRKRKRIPVSKKGKYQRQTIH